MMVNKVKYICKCLVAGLLMLVSLTGCYSFFTGDLPLDEEPETVGVNSGTYEISYLHFGFEHSYRSRGGNKEKINAAIEKPLAAAGFKSASAIPARGIHLKIYLRPVDHRPNMLGLVSGMLTGLTLGILPGYTGSVENYLHTDLYRDGRLLKSYQNSVDMHFLIGIWFISGDDLDIENLPVDAYARESLEQAVVRLLQDVRSDQSLKGLSYEDAMNKKVVLKDGRSFYYCRVNKANNELECMRGLRLKLEPGSIRSQTEIK